jgi:hypothetical protein
MGLLIWTCSVWLWSWRKNPMVSAGFEHETSWCNPGFCVTAYCLHNRLILRQCVGTRYACVHARTGWCKNDVSFKMEGTKLNSHTGLNEALSRCIEHVSMCVLNDVFGLVDSLNRKLFSIFMLKITIFTFILNTRWKTQLRWKLQLNLSNPQNGYKILHILIR